MTDGSENCNRLLSLEHLYVCEMQSKSKTVGFTIAGKEMLAVHNAISVQKILTCGSGTKQSAVLQFVEKLIEKLIEKVQGSAVMRQTRTPFS